MAAEHDALGTGAGGEAIRRGHDPVWAAVLEARAQLAWKRRQDLHMDLARAIRDVIFD